MALGSHSSKEADKFTTPLSTLFKETLQHP